MHLLDAILSFAAVMLIASLVVTAGTQLIISVLGLRGANLRNSLGDLFENACDDRDAKRYGRVIARRVLRHPLISGSAFSRFGIRVEELPFVPADAAGKLRWAGAGIPFQPWLLGAATGFFLWPASLAAIERLSNLDVAAFSSLVANYVPVVNLVDHPWRTGAILGALFGGLMSRWRLANSVRVDELVAVLEKLSTPPGGSLPDPAQRAMLVIAGEAQSGPRPKANAASAQFDKFVKETPEDDDPDLALAVEKTLKQVAGQTETRLDGVNSWFEHVMDRASQRFTLQARVITVAVALLVVCVAHLDAIRLFRTLSSEAQVRMQLFDSADALNKGAGQLSRTRDESASKVVFPDIYRKVMSDVLQSVPLTVQQPKSKSRHSSHHNAASAQPEVAAQPGGSSAEATDSAQASSAAPAESGVFVAAVSLTTEALVKEKGRKGSKSKSKLMPVEAVKPVVSSAEDKAGLEAKARANKILETTPGFASREDAVSWLRASLHGNPALENIVASYEVAVNADLQTDGDKLLDQAASLKHDLARSEFQLFPENWTGWKPNRGEMPGLLIALALLSLGAPICFNLLNKLASLGPRALTAQSVYSERRLRREDRPYSHPREQSKPPLKTATKAAEKTEQEPAVSGRGDRRV